MPLVNLPGLALFIREMNSAILYAIALLALSSAAHAWSYRDVVAVDNFHLNETN